MAIKVTRRPDFAKMSDELNRLLEDTFDSAILDEVEELVSRTESGLDVNGARFVAYSPAYAAKRAEAGKGTRPNLTWSGNMLVSITHTVRRVGKSIIGTVFFNSSKEALKAEGNMKNREFFGFSEEQIQNIKEAIRRAINGRG